MLLLLEALSADARDTGLEAIAADVSGMSGLFLQP